MGGHGPQDPPPGGGIRDARQPLLQPGDPPGGRVSGTFLVALCSRRERQRDVDQGVAGLDPIGREAPLRRGQRHLSRALGLSSRELDPRRYGEAQAPMEGAPR